MGDIPCIASDKIVHRNNGMAFGQKTITQMRTQKTSAASDKDTQLNTPLLNLVQIYRQFTITLAG